MTKLFLRHGDHAALDALAPKRNKSCPTSAAGLAPLNKNPCTSLQPSARSESSCSFVSTPSASQGQKANNQYLALSTDQ
ncbi:hypothetical protein [Bradyrhizobium japonicum]|uniref:hypothetical protein n=1 Tax=Bradyrhizobium japonicum TaxID=375 RepID=UPI001E5C5643|nr:hypothetical protein [Bradyrhizobium japonicum]MCD9898270.1 hypothetical protein [Bradyrhizobium japonicum]MEB2671239.1 hypothetical protein [Bradyrhizobium japonicum]WLB28531.1 hypothetical protein QIH85_43170 [Bradyrhizobium japonicum]WRI90554.1 hypothetical protein R3F75_06400 [Bradyrhizobium japonicum]WRK47537.1 hypothetical protein R3F73_05250 [Bradyrhizobium japonicum]